jgi:hypothetical protein
MSSNVTPVKPALNISNESNAIIWQGANQGQICALFGMDKKTVNEKLTKHNLKPVGRRNNVDIYSVREIAPYMVRPAYDIEAYIKRMNPNDLPKHLGKEFWAGMKSRQDYEERAGLLWRTEKVVASVGELLKLVKMSTLLMMDALERQTELSERQREIIKSLSHGMLEDLVARIEKDFKMPTEEDLSKAKADVKYQEDPNDEEL